MILIYPDYCSALGQSKSREKQCNLCRLFGNCSSRINHLASIGIRTPKKICWMVVWFEWCAAKWGINASSLLRSSASALLREHAGKPYTRVLFLKSVDPPRMQSQEDLPSSSTAHCSFGACGHERRGSLQMGSSSVSAACQGRPRSHVARHADTCFKIQDFHVSLRGTELVRYKRFKCSGHLFFNM